MAVQDIKFVRWLITLARNSPWLFIAVGLHVIIALVMSIMVITHATKEPTDSVTEIGVATSRSEPLQEIVQPEEELDRKKIPENDVVQELVTYEEETTFVPTEDVIEEDLYQDIGDPTGADDGSEAFTGGTSIGVGSGGHYGTGNPSAFASRRAATTNRTKKGRAAKGQTTGTEEAVLEGLRWLVRHQNEDGSWGVDTLASHCKGGEPCVPADVELVSYYNEGLTGLALLAFLGQGISVGSKIEIVDNAMGKRHQAGDVVKKGVRWLIDRQRENGALADPDAPYNMYSQALATMALCEAYGLSKNRELKRPAQEAVNFLVAAQKVGPDGAPWGWRYFGKQVLDESLAAGKIDQTTHSSLVQENDISVTTWVVMALKSADLCGLDVPSAAMEGALAYAESCTGKEGLVGYTSSYGAGEIIRGPRDQFAYHTGTMSSLGMLVRTFVRHELEDPFLEVAAKHIVKDPPTVSKDKLSIDYYYWYYATLALNQFDGPDSPRKGGKYWDGWNKALIESILPLQNDSKARDVCSRGGWLDIDRWGGYTGHSLYATALNVLTLQVYYRYDNAFGVDAAR